MSGCAHTPRASSGAEARTRLFAALASGGRPVRGVGQIQAHMGSRSGSFEARWGSQGESLVVIGYAGPARIVDASLLRDSLYLGLRRDDFAVTGPLRPSDGLGVDGLRFLLRPYDFGPAWIREALERAEIEPSKDGWRLRGDGQTSAGTVAFTLDVTGAGEPRRLELVRRGDGVTGESAVVRYGALRGFGAGRYPRWIEWQRGVARVRIDLRDVDPLPGGTLRLLAPPPSDWRVVGLETEEGRKFMKRLFGQDAEPSGATSAPPPEGSR